MCKDVVGHFAHRRYGRERNQHPKVVNVAFVTGPYDKRFDAVLVEDVCLITYVYNELFDHKDVFPNLIAHRFSELVIDVYPMFVIPLMMAGILGVFLGRYFKILP